MGQNDCLNTFLSMTGGFGNIMFILTTNSPSMLDSAVLDRMDEIIELPLPSAKEREVLLRDQLFCRFRPRADDHSLLLSKLLRRSTKARFAVNFDVNSCISHLATKTHGFSGRELEKIIQGVLHKTYASDKGVLESILWENETEKLRKTHET